jgi:hypothetical protein
MSAIRTYSWITAFLYLSLQLPAQETELKFRLRPGETYTLDIELHQDTHSESAGSDEITLYGRMKLDFLVDSVDGKGFIYMSAGYRDLLLSMLAPTMGIDINSERGRNSMLAAMLDSLQQPVFRMVIHPSGELDTLEELTSLFERISEGPAADTGEHEVILKTLDEVYGPDAFRSLCNLFVSVYPVVQPIRNWTRDFTFYFNTKPVQVVNRYYLTKTTDEVIIIQGMGMLTSDEPYHEKNGKREVTSTVSGSQTYDFQMDIGTGWLKECLSRQRLVIETTIVSDPHLPGGLQIPSYTETLYEVKGSHSGQETGLHD